MASSSSQSKYEVFLSFRGGDTRIGFTSHLAAALHRKQIQFFIDDDELKKGDEISPALLNAIEESDISIIIFSKNYASSKWCLNELVKILDCKKKNGQIVIPVFYQVDPSDVRKQTGSFGEAFVHLENNFPDKVKKWRDALTEASNLSGYDSTESRNEAELVEKIVADISKKLEDVSDSTDLDGFVGLNSRIEELKSLLCLELYDVRIVGIWGMGGIGKTTIASFVFHLISRDFQGKCFMRNVREESNKKGAVHVRDEVISEVLGENLKIGTSIIPPRIQKRLQLMKVLIVLDDVHGEFTELESLARGLRFSHGSRIILTSRDKGVFDKCGVNNVYEVKGLKHNQAFELFCRKAFRENNRCHDLLELSEKVVCYAHGNPLALEVLGSSLYQKSKQQWKVKLQNLKLISVTNIYNVLKISYDELNLEGKKVFLDIACFFKGENIDFVREIQDDPTSLDTLVDKSLITISCNKWVQMHDLLQEMGQTIVRQKSVNKRSRLWDHEEVFHVLKNNKGTDKIEGMFLDLSKINDIHLSPQAFANMSNLRFLKFYMPEHNDVPIMSSKVHLDQGLEYLPNELRYLHWHEYPLKTLPFDFEPENLIKLNLPYSKVVQIWEGKKNAFKLRYVDLHHSQYLITMPDISKSSNLKNCTNLACVPSSIKNFNHLSWLCFKGCKSFTSFPSNLHFVSPVTIDFSSCVNLTEFPQISGNIAKLNLSETTIEEVPSTIECLTNLKELRLSNCTRLKRLSTSICKLKSLHVLILNDCLNLESFPEILEKMESLKCISLEKTAITELPSSFANLEGLKDLSAGGSSLRRLNLSGNDCESLSASIKQLSRLKYLDLRDCSMLSSLPELPLSLELLNAENCKRLQSLPEIPSGLEEVDASIVEKAKLAAPQNMNPKAIKFVFTNCLKLKEKSNNEILADSQLRIQHMAIATFRLLDEKKERLTLRGPSIIFPGSEIPEWFSNQSSGTSITLQLPQHCCQNLFGFALCAVLDHNKLQGPFNNMLHYVRCKYSFQMNNHSETKHVYQSWHLAWIDESIDSDHVILGFNPCRNVGFPDSGLQRIWFKFFDIHNHHTTLSFEFICDRFKVKCCGVCPVYADPSETKPNTFTLKFAAKISKLDDNAASTSGTSDEEELEPSAKRICRDQINTP